MRYTIPSLTASAFLPPSSDSRAARHMAHCAFTANEDQHSTAVKKRYLSLVCIVRTDHQINNYAGDGHVKPNWERVFCDFFVVFKFLCQGAYIGNEH